MPVTTKPPRRPSAFQRPLREPERPTANRTRRFFGRSFTVSRPGGHALTLSMTAVALLSVVVLIILGLPLYNLANSLHRHHQVSLELAQAQAQRRELTRDLERWSDPDYISAQARQRLGYVKPGETRYKVVDPGAKYLTHTHEGDNVSDRPWFLAIADSAVAADKREDKAAQVSTSRRGTPAEGATQVPQKENP